MENTNVFPAKKLMERLYSLGLVELSMILQDFGNMVFPAVSNVDPKSKSKSCKDVYYLPYYRNVKKYIKQLEFRSFDFDLTCANTCSM